VQSGVRESRPPSNVTRPAYGTSNETGALQSPWPALVTGQDRNCTVVPDGRPVIDVFDCSVEGITTHVLPPSVLYSQLCEARRAAAGAVSSGDEAGLGREDVRMARRGLARGHARAVDDGHAVFEVGVDDGLDVGLELFEQPDQDGLLLVARRDGALGARQGALLGRLQGRDGRRHRRERNALTFVRSSAEGGRTGSCNARSVNSRAA
jgi:hypothetical protein